MGRKAPLVRIRFGDKTFEIYSEYLAQIIIQALLLDKKSLEIKVEDE